MSTAVYTTNFAPLILIPGPMVELNTMLLMYVPFEAAGFALIIASIRAVKFSSSFSLPKLFLPMIT